MNCEQDPHGYKLNTSNTFVVSSDLLLNSSEERVRLLSTN